MTLTDTHRYNGGVLRGSATIPALQAFNGGDHTARCTEIWGPAPR